METGLSDRVVLITGGAGGVGRAAAARFLEEGSVVIVADLDEEAARSAADDLAAGARPAHGIGLDVTDIGAIEAAIAGVVERHDRLDVLVNAAGLWTEGPAEAATEADWDRVVDVNLKGLFFCCARAIPYLRQTQGCIVNVASDAGLVGTPETSVYSAGKGGVVLLTKVLALELAPSLVRANAVCPADVMTPMLEGQARDFGGGDEDGYLRTLLTCYAQGDKARFIEPAEVAELIVYLASAAAAPITGAAVPIDFGTTAGYGYG